MMALSESDKREIAAMFESFSQRMGPGRQVISAEEQALEILAKAIYPTVVGPRFVPLEERAVGAVLETALVPSKRKKAMTKFNKAVKEGMKIVRSSSSYGKKGTISNSKKAFAAVTKSVSKARKGAKLPKKGVLRRVQSKAKGILGKMSKIAKKRGKPRGETIYSSPGSLPAFLKKESYYRR
jgi:hypothetical protein